MSTHCAACNAAKLDDWVICLTCQEKTVGLLEKIPALHRALSQDARLKLPEKTEQERPSGQTSYGAPANLHAVMLNSEKEKKEIQVGFCGENLPLEAWVRIEK